MLSSIISLILKKYAKLFILKIKLIYLRQIILKTRSKLTDYLDNLDEKAELEAGTSYEDEDGETFDVHTFNEKMKEMLKDISDSIDQHELVGDLGRCIEENVKREHAVEDYLSTQHMAFERLQNRMTFQMERNLVNQNEDEEDELSQGQAKFFNLSCAIIIKVIPQ